MICRTIGIVSVAPAPQETGISTASTPGSAAVTTAVAGRQTGGPGGAVRAGHMVLAPAGAGHRHHDARSWAPVRVDDGAFDRASRLAGRQRGGRQRQQYGGDGEAGRGTGDQCYGVDTGDPLSEYSTRQTTGGGAKRVTPTPPAAGGPQRSRGGRTTRRRSRRPGHRAAPGESCFGPRGQALAGQFRRARGRAVSRGADATHHPARRGRLGGLADRGPSCGTGDPFHAVLRIRSAAGPRRPEPRAPHAPPADWVVTPCRFGENPHGG